MAAAQENKSKHSILTIPPELFEHIAEEVDAQDLLALRLVSKETNGKVFRTFLDVHFTERAFLLSSEESLRVLLAISENETFARSLRVVELCIDEVPSKDHKIRQREESEPGLKTLPPQERVKQQTEIECRDTMCDSRKRFRQSNADLHILATIFSRFRCLSHLFELRLLDIHIACEVPILTTTLELMSGEELVRTEDSARVISVVLEALVLSDFKIRSFTSRFDNWGWPLAALTETPQKYINAKTVFGNLKELHLMCDYKTQDSHRDLVDTLGGLLASANQVQILSVECFAYCWQLTDPNTYESTCATLPKCFQGHGPAVKFLNLQGFDISKKDLAGIINSNPNLEYLHFHAGYAHAYNAPHGFERSEEGECLAFPKTDMWSPCKALSKVSVPPGTAVELDEGREKWDGILEQMVDHFEDRYC